MFQFLREVYRFLWSEIFYHFGLRGPWFFAAVPVYADRLSRPSAWSRFCAIVWLGTRGPSAFLAVRPLLNVTRTDEKPFLRRCAHWALNRIGSLENDTVPVLAYALANRSRWPERFYAIWLIGQLGLLRHEYLEELTAALHDGSPLIRAAAARTLGRYELEASGALPILFELLNDPHVAVRERAAGAIWLIGKRQKANA